MVDLAEIQAAYYMVAATGVIVAAVFYVLNLKETSKNRRVTLTNNIMQFYTSEEKQRNAIDLLSMNWVDFEDFYRKYDSTVNPDNYAKRAAAWAFYENLGSLYRTDLLDVETLYRVAAVSTINTWVKFKPIIDEYRKFDYGRDAYSNWEFLVGELVKIKSQRDSSWKGSRSYIEVDQFDEVFKK
jgi:hypothetical protein